MGKKLEIITVDGKSRTVDSSDATIDILNRRAELNNNKNYRKIFI